MTYQKDESIEVLDFDGNWVPGVYQFPLPDSQTCENHVIQCSLIQCSLISYTYLKVSDEKIRKIQ